MGAAASGCMHAEKKGRIDAKVRLRAWMSPWMTHMDEVANDA
jgi:hypothetical protein